MSKRSRFFTTPISPIQPHGLKKPTLSLSRVPLPPPALSIVSTPTIDSPSSKTVASPPPASKRARLAVEEEDFTCSVCLENVAASSRAVLPCAHFFHLACIRDWSKRGTNMCPLCKARFVSMAVGPNKETMSVSVKKIVRVSSSESESDGSTEEEDETEDDYELDGFVVNDDESISEIDSEEERDLGTWLPDTP